MNHHQQLEKLERAIQEVNKDIKRFSRVPLRKQDLEAKRRELREEQTKIKEALVLEGFGIDLTSISVIQLSKKKSRYLRNNEGYHNNLNLIVAHSLKENKGYAIFTPKTQIRKKDLALLFKLAGIKKGYTDNRHKGIVTLSKKYTQRIERIFSVVKRRIYKKLKPLQSWKKNKVFTDIKREQLINLYQVEFMKENITFLNQPNK